MAKRNMASKNQTIFEGDFDLIFIAFRLPNVARRCSLSHNEPECSFFSTIPCNVLEVVNHTVVGY